MSKIKKPSRWRSIPLVDRCLFLFMFLLIIQSVYNLFAHEVALSDASSLDSALRTTASGIFGYFISGGTLIKSKENLPETTITTTPISIGFQPSSPSARLAAEEDTFATTHTLSTPPLVTNQSPSTKRFHQQTVMVTLIGLVSLGILIVARDFATLNTTSIATIAQFRDFTSGSVGFLIGRANSNLE